MALPLSVTHRSCQRQRFLERRDHLCGHVGPLQLDDAVLPELTWTLWSEAAEGKGFAHEAAQAVNTWFFGPFGCKEAMAEVQRGNSRSHALAKRLGGVAWPDGPKGWMDDGIVYRFRVKVATSSN